MTLIAQPTAPAPRHLPGRVPGESSARANRIAWAAVLLLVLAQWGMFRQFALREVTCSYPGFGDQLVYLDQSYRTYERILDRGLLRGLADGAGLTPDSLPLRETGATLHLQAAMLFLMTGPSRMTALSLNFIYMALFQLALVATVRWLTGRWWAAFLALGLVLTAATGFGQAGGLFDFRIDFMAFCLFGVFLCVVIRSGTFDDRRWAALAGLCGAALGALRFISLAYLLGVFALVGLFLVVQWVRGWDDLPGQQAVQRRLGGMFLAGAVIAVLTGPILWHHRHVIYTYYFLGHVEGPEQAFRARAAGTTTFWANLAYTPMSLLRDHAGYAFLALAGTVLAISGATSAMASRAARRARAATEERDRSVSLDVSTTMAFLLSCVLAPMAAQTLDRAKSPVVADVMVAPLVWLVAFGVIWASGAFRGRRMPPLAAGGLAVAAAVAMAFAGWRQSSAYCRRTWVSNHRPEVEKILGMYDRMRESCLALSWRSPSVVSDQLIDFLSPMNLTVLAYEQTGKLLHVHSPLDGLYAFRDAGVDDAIRKADFVILTRADGVSVNVESPFPYDRQMRNLHPRLSAWCGANMVEIDEYRLGPPLGRDVSLFVRPALDIQAASDGWVTSRGLVVSALAPVLRTRPTILLSGHCDIRPLGGIPKVTAIVVAPDGTTTDAPATMTWSDYAYRIQVHVDPARLPPGGAVRVRLTFDRFFVPGRLGTSADTRELVMQAPDEGHLQ